jgi:succinyl-CoA synthetase beta subunit
MGRGLDQALSAAARIGYPVALKAVSHSLLHKSDQGGIALNVRDGGDLEREWRRLQSISTDLQGIVIQKMATVSRELIVGAKRDPTFGPMVLVGMGGILVEVLKDVSMRLAPVGRAEAFEMLGELRASKLLGEFRGMKAVDPGAVAEVIVRVSHLIVGFPQLREIDINPLGVEAETGRLMALDARVLIGEHS